MTIKLLIVDDSALMRRHLTQLFESEGRFEIRHARNGADAVRENLEFEPDVITLDINMPEMDGLTALSHIMTARPVPVVMVSSLTERGALTTFEALALGAVDYVAKPSGTISLSIDEIQAELLQKVCAAAGARIRPKRSNNTTGLREKLKAERAASVTARKNQAAAASEPLSEGLVLVGVSTGGPGTLEGILPLLPADFPLPVVVAQHMPSAFTGPFANRMNSMCELEVLEVSRPMPLEAGKVYIAKGGADCIIGNRQGVLTAIPKPEDPQFLWHPSVEILGATALEHLPASHLIGVILTGMGNDGSKSFARIKAEGGKTIAESEETSVVFGMPKELIAAGGASLTLEADKVAQQLIKWTR